MGCGASTEGTHVQPFFGHNGETVDDDCSVVDYSIGFSAKACTRFGISEGADEESESFDNNREETDEFRVLRVSALSGQVTLYVAGGKHKKPVQYDHNRLCPRAHEQPQKCSKCPFCVGNEGKTPPNVLSFDEDGTECAAGIHHDNWKLRVFPNIFPMLICPKDLYGQAHHEALEKLPHSAVARGVHHNIKVSNKLDPTCIQVDAEGTSEVFVESNVHNALLALQDPKSIEFLLKAIKIRCAVLSRKEWVKQILIFKQYGPLSGGSLVHPHSQVVTLPVMPPQLLSRLEFHAHIHEKHGRCATCLACIDPFVEDPEGTDSTEATLRRTPSSPKLRPSGVDSMEDSRLVHLTDYFVVSVPYASSSQYSLTVAPRRHCAHFHDISDDEIQDLAVVLALLSQALYNGLDDPSYNVFVRTAPSCESFKLGMHAEEVRGDELRKICHWIVEIRPRFPADLGGFEIASGIRVVSGLPEDHAAEMRKWVQERLQASMEPIKSFERKGSRMSTGGVTKEQSAPRKSTKEVSSHTLGPERATSRSKSEKLHCRDKGGESPAHPHAITISEPVLIH